MQVWELMSSLAKYPAGAEVRVSVHDSSCTDIEYLEMLDEDNVHLVGGEAQLLDSESNELGALSEFIPEEECE